MLTAPQQPSVSPRFWKSAATIASRIRSSVKTLLDAVVEASPDTLAVRVSRSEHPVRQSHRERSPCIPSQDATLSVRLGVVLSTQRGRLGVDRFMRDLYVPQFRDD